MARLKRPVVCSSKVIQLTEQQRLQLEKGFRKGNRHAYRMRCRAILLNSTGLTSEQVEEQTDMTHISVNSWVKRFETEGIKGLETRPGRGRKPIMDCSDEESVRNADYCSTDSLLYATNRTLAALGSELNINFAHEA